MCSNGQLWFASEQVRPTSCSIEGHDQRARTMLIHYHRPNKNKLSPQDMNRIDRLTTNEPLSCTCTRILFSLLSPFLRLQKGNHNVCTLWNEVGSLSSHDNLFSYHVCKKVVFSSMGREKWVELFSVHRATRKDTFRPILSWKTKKTVCFQGK